MISTYNILVSLSKLHFGTPPTNFSLLRMFCNLLGEQLGQGCCASFPPTAFVSSSKKAADDLAISENSLKN